jgi:hypothetical protein
MHASGALRLLPDGPRILISSLSPHPDTRRALHSHLHPHPSPHCNPRPYSSALRLREGKVVLKL